MEIPAEPLHPHIPDHELLRKLLKDNYGLTALRLKPLNGYHDLNFHVTVDTNHTNPYIQDVSPHGYFLKVSSLEESARPELLYAQVTEMECLRKKGIKCQVPIKGLKGELFTECTTPDKKGVTVTYLMSLRTFLPGQIVADVSMTAELAYNLGLFVAKVTKALEDFRHPVYDDRDYLWSMNNIPIVSRAAFAVKDQKRRKLAEEIIEAFSRDVVPQKPHFRKGHIHGDLNEQNILVTIETSPDITPKICGLLDFQDSATTFPLYELSINLAYMMMVKQSSIPRLDIAGHILAGYTSLLTLPAAERAVLRTAVAGRMAQSLVYGAYSYYLDPSNEYVLETSRCGWQVMESLWSSNEEDLWRRWSEIIGSYDK